MRKLSLIVIASMLTSCSVAPRDTSLRGLDLNDPNLVRSLSQDLSGKDRAAFATYALLHWPGSRSFCGHREFSDTQAASTVGEAIDRTLDFERKLESKRLAETTIGSQLANREERARQLISEFEDLTLERNRVESSNLDQATKRDRLRDLDRRLDANRELRRASPIGSLL